MPQCATLSSIRARVKHASSRRSLHACERQDIPDQEHLLCRAAPDFPARPADSYPVRELCPPPGREVLQEAQVPPRRFRGQRLVLSGRGQMWVRVRSAACSSWRPLLRDRGGETCAHFLRLFSAPTWFIGFGSLRQLDMRSGVQLMRGSSFDGDQHKRQERLFVPLLMGQ